MDQGPFRQQQQPRYGPQGPAYPDTYPNPQQPAYGLKPGYTVAAGPYPYIFNGQNYGVPAQAGGQYHAATAGASRTYSAGQLAAADRARVTGEKRRFADEPAPSPRQQQQLQQARQEVAPPRPPPGHPPGMPPAGTRTTATTTYPYQQDQYRNQQDQYKNQQDPSRDQGWAPRPDQKPSSRSADPYLAYYGSRTFTQQSQSAGPPAPAPAPAPAPGPARHLEGRSQHEHYAQPTPRTTSAAGAAPSTSGRGLPNGRQQQHQQHVQPASSGDEVYNSSSKQLEELRKRGSTHGHVYTRLTQNIVDLVQRLGPDAEALRHRRQVLQAVTEAVRQAFPEYPNARVRPFGSFVSGLGTEQSDMDLVITGIQDPPSDTGFYAQYQRPQIARLLDRATSAFFRHPDLRNQIKKHLLIRSARIPIAKFTLGSGLVIDLSIAGDSGPAAAAYLAREVAAWPALRPLALTVKAYLKAQQANDVSMGGLSSYGLTYMVLAHLQEERKADSDTEDLGYMLHRFFTRFGASYDRRTYCVAVGLGGVVTRWHALNSGADYFKNNDRLATVDPLTGRDCTEGCYETERVTDALCSGEKYLNATVSKYKGQTLSQLSQIDLLQGLVYSIHFEDDEDEEEQYQNLGLGMNWPRKRR